VETTALAVVDMLQPDYPHTPVVDLALYVGHGGLPCRLLAYRLPEAVVQQRRSTASEAAQRKGRTPTQAYIRWLQFGWYITNASHEVWPAAVVATVYRVRWPIEISQPHYGSRERLYFTAA